MKTSEYKRDHNGSVVSASYNNPRANMTSKNKFDALKGDISHAPTII